MPREKTLWELQYAKQFEREFAIEKADPNSQHWHNMAAMWRLVVKNAGGQNHPALVAEYDTAKAEVEAIRQALSEVLANAVKG